MAFDISNSLNSSVVISTTLFFVFVWIMAHKAIYSLKTLKKNKLSLIIAAALVGWFSIVFFLGKISFFAYNPLVASNILLSFIILFVILQKVYLSKTIKNIADRIPIHLLIGIQVYRVAGVGFLMLYSQNLLPAEFAFPAGIGDILVGMTAPIVALIYYLKKSYSQKLAMLWNTIGIADLVIALSIGIFGYPRPIQVLPTTPSTELLSLFPWVLVPLFAVPLALLLHFLLLRILKNQKVKNV